MLFFSVTGLIHLCFEVHSNKECGVFLIAASKSFLSHLPSVEILVCLNSSLIFPKLVLSYLRTMQLLMEASR